MPVLLRCQLVAHQCEAAILTLVPLSSLLRACCLYLSSVQMKPIRADRYLLVRAQAVKQEGRKTYVNISVEDGEGTIFARGTALYVKPKMLPTAVLLSATQ